MREHAYDVCFFLMKDNGGSLECRRNGEKGKERERERKATGSFAMVQS